MSNKTGIQWTDSTWNPWHGCTKISKGCKYCYMYRDKERYGQDPTTVLRSKTKFSEPLKWKENKLVFTCSWSDFFIKEADSWRDEAWRIIKSTPHLTYQILTKRPVRVKDNLPSDWGDNGYKNVWLGVSVESQDEISRIHELLKIPSYCYFASLEPLLSPIDLISENILCTNPKLSKSELSWREVTTAMNYLDWVIVGGESGGNKKYKFRPCELDWIKNIVSQCSQAHTPVFVKQLGTHLKRQLYLTDNHGGNINEFPLDLQIRQMPYCYKELL